MLANSRSNDGGQGIFRCIEPLTAREAFQRWSGGMSIQGDNVPLKCVDLCVRGREVSKAHPPCLLLITSIVVIRGYSRRIPFGGSGTEYITTLYSYILLYLYVGPTPFFHPTLCQVQKGGLNYAYSVWRMGSREEGYSFRYPYKSIAYHTIICAIMYTWYLGSYEVGTPVVSGTEYEYENFLS